MSTIFSRKQSTDLELAVVQQYNALHEATISTTTDGYHRDISGVPSGDFSAPTSSALAVVGTATTLATVTALSLSIQGVLHAHFGDDSAHLKADAVNIALGLDGYAVDLTSPTTNQNTVNALLNAAKLVFDAHLTQSGVHRKSDTANSVSATPAATDLASSETLALALKASVNAHILSGPTVGRIKVVPA